MPVVVATGRMYKSALPWAIELCITAPLVCYQGAVVREIAAEGSIGGLLFACELRPEPALRALQIAREHGWHFNAYQDDELLCDQDRPEAHLYARIAGVPITFVPDLQPLLHRGSTKAVCVIEDRVEMERCVETLREGLGDSARVTWSLPVFVEVVNPAVSKAVAVDLALARFGTSLAETAAIGDAPNDIQMLEEAGFAVAVRGAPESVVEHADAVCELPEHGGVADVLGALGLC